MASTLTVRKSLSDRAKARARRQARGRKKIFGTVERPRMVVTRSSKHVFVQVIDDVAGNTLVSASTMEAELREMSGDKTAKAARVGTIIGERAKLLALPRSCSTRPETSTTGGSPRWPMRPARPVSTSDPRKASEQR